MQRGLKQYSVLLISYMQDALPSQELTIAELEWEAVQTLAGLSALVQQDSKHDVPQGNVQLCYCGLPVRTQVQLFGPHAGKPRLVCVHFRPNGVGVPQRHGCGYCRFPSNVQEEREWITSLYVPFIHMAPSPTYLCLITDPSRRLLSHRLVSGILPPNNRKRSPVWRFCHQLQPRRNCGLKCGRGWKKKKSRHEAAVIIIED